MSRGAGDRPVLLRLPFSHYCKKAEACLSQAGIPYDVLDVGVRHFPLPVGEGTVPVLRVGDRVLTDSEAIVDWAEAHAAPGTVPLHATDDAVRTWTRWADEEVGPVARRVAYRCIHDDPRSFTRRRALRVGLRVARPLVLRILKSYRARRYEEHDAGAGPVIIARIAAGLEASGTGHLVGDQPTAADHAVACLVAPLVQAGAWAGLDAEPGFDAVAAHAARHRGPLLGRGRRRARARDLAAWSRLEPMVAKRSTAAG